MNENNQVLEEIIKYRRSIFPKSYNNTPVSKQTIEKILQSANHAPTHKLTQPWRFKVYRGKALNRLADLLADCYVKDTPPEKYSEMKHKKRREKVLASSAMIAICVKLSGKVPEWEEIASVACSVQNMWLTASSLGVGSYWSTPGKPESYHEFLGLGENERCLGFFYLGNHDLPAKEGIRTPIEEKVEWNES